MREQVFLEQVKKVVPLAALVEVVATFFPGGKTGPLSLSLHTMFCVHCMQKWFLLSNPSMEEIFFYTPLYRAFARSVSLGVCLTKHHFVFLAQA